MSFTFTSLSNPLDEIISKASAKEKDNHQIDSIIEHLQKANWELNQFTPDESEELLNVVDNITKINHIIEWLENL